VVENDERQPARFWSLEWGAGRVDREVGRRRRACSKLPLARTAAVTNRRQDAIHFGSIECGVFHSSSSYPNVAPERHKPLAVSEDDADLVLQGYGLAEYNDVMNGVEIHAGDKVPLDLELRTAADK
jgi:hypothetical protein